MKKLIAISIAAFFIVGAVSAQNPHINKKDRANVVATATPEEVCFSGVVAGNGNASSVNAYLIVDVEADTYCFNPAGGAKADIGVPGHMDFTVVGEAETFDCRNGKAYIENVCAALDIVVDCPNPKWAGVVENLVIKSVVLVINGKLLDVTSYYN
jgi:hypothetical protein